MRTLWPIAVPLALMIGARSAMRREDRRQRGDASRPIDTWTVKR